VRHNEEKKWKWYWCKYRGLNDVVLVREELVLALSSGPHLLVLPAAHLQLRSERSSTPNRGGRRSEARTLVQYSSRRCGRPVMRSRRRSMGMTTMAKKTPTRPAHNPH
jgi:hypothetical protein